MKSIQDYELEGKNFLRATFFGVFLMLGSIVLHFIFDFDISFIQNPTKNFILAIVYILAYVAFIAIWIIAIVWTYRIAVENERGGVSWGIFAFFMPSIALISISIIGEKFENDEIKNIVLRTRKGYMSAKSKVYNNHSMTKEEQNDAADKIKEKFEMKLKERLVDLKADSLVEYLQLLKEQEQIEFDFDSNSQKQVLINDITENITDPLGEFKRCPACNSIISDDSVICSDCEIILK